MNKIKKCKYCNIEFEKPKKYSIKQWENAKFCCNSCKMKFILREKIKDKAYIEFLRKIATGRKQSEETKIKRGIYRVGSESSRWKGGISFDKNNGYFRENITGKRIHRKIVEDFLGRSLKNNEQIHHINGIKTDNRIENLIITSRSEHKKFHDSYKIRHGISGPNNIKLIAQRWIKEF